MALLAVAALRKGSKLAIPLVWIFSFVGAGDLIYAGVMAAKYEAFNHTGGMYYVLGWYVPALVVTHVVVIRMLIDGGTLKE